MRVGETIALDRSVIDWAEAVIVVRSTKFHKSRELPWTRPRSTRWRATPRSGIDACPARRARRSSSPATAHRSSTPTSEPSSAHSWPRPGSGLTHRPSPAFTTYATASRCTPGPLVSSRRGRRGPAAQAVDLPRPSHPGLHLLVPLCRPRAAGARAGRLQDADRRRDR
jgi:hypothetical protein